MNEKIRLTLQSRITNFIIIFVILLISAFTIIQVDNQLKTVTNYNSYRAKVSALFIKVTINKILENVTSPTEVSNILTESLNSLGKSGLIEDWIATSRENRIIASLDRSLIGKPIIPEEAGTVKEVFESIGKTKEILNYIDRPTKTLFMYIPIAAGNAENYVVRTTFSLGNMQEVLKQAYIPIIFTVISVILIVVAFGFILSRTIVGPITLLNKATKDIASGNFDLSVNLTTGDELQELADTFNDMAVALKKMKERAENANPLTKLPGNNVIREEIEKRIDKGEKFVVVHADLDNFKEFNDEYGIHRGDEAIKITSSVVQDALKKKGAPNDFLGHSGGDDFVFVSSVDTTDDVSNYIIQEFDRRIRLLYKKEDLERGYIVTKNREGKITKFPIMTISLSGVSNLYRPLESYAEVTNIDADVKKKVKSIPKSVYFLDKRTKERVPSASDTSKKESDT
ncbi:MAG: hypothetical protein COS99_03925 [Candidatus Omnitrophica bacterium CG07_land_8_20_14_0_80_42_15]|uniref:histidine kinase n=1 Tax=Candidatus Aquitaenariimonas noxiae TaxID=1974741 RepID=A0A2J0L5B9_9BACT|nr:MAG: hypothetical protein COS99_03925 [Candidatus Omnitrophica bacterium CG07_land_8_20_14_0_80_42_15]